MIYATPSSTFTAVLDGASTGLVGTLGVRIENADGTNQTARTTAGIVELEAASGVYAKRDLIAPSTAGEYVVIWDTGGGTPVFGSEELLVTSTLGTPVSPTGSDLTTLANVRVMLQKPLADTGQDSLIQMLITRASATIKSYTRREFTQTAGAVRKFVYHPNKRGFLDLGPYDLRAVDVIRIDTDGTAPTPTTLTTADYRFEPRGKPEGVWTSVRLGYAASLGGAVSIWRERELEITGDWGFPAVPSDVEDACIKTVALWLRRDASGYDAGASEGVWVRPLDLPSAVMAALNRYRRQLG